MLKKGLVTDGNITVVRPFFRFDRAQANPTESPN